VTPCREGVILSKAKDLIFAWIDAEKIKSRFFVAKLLRMTFKKEDRQCT